MSRHLHVWAEVRRVYTPPPRSVSVQGISREQADRFAFGITTAELQCELCGALDSAVFLGDLSTEANDARS